MKRGLQLVRKFHKAFGCPTNDIPSLLPEFDYTLRHKLMEEENNEYLDACDNEDIQGIVDALGDKAYVLFGTIISHGLQEIIEEVFVEIHRSNMSKLDKDGNPIINGENGITNEDKPIGKILKGDSYFPPNIDKILTELFQKEVNSKFLDDELKEHLDKKYEQREVLMKKVIKEKLSEKDWKRFQKFEKDADFFSDKVQLLEDRQSYDLTKFGVRIGGEEHWITEKEEGDY